RGCRSAAVRPCPPNTLGRKMVMSRSRKACRRSGGPRPPGCVRPQLLTLEDRLPLGDALLGALTGAARAGSRPAGPRAHPRVPAHPARAGSAAGPAAPGAAARTGLSTLLALFPGGQGQARRGGGRAPSASAWGGGSGGTATPLFGESPIRGVGSPRGAAVPFLLP